MRGKYIKKLIAYFLIVTQLVTINVTKAFALEDTTKNENQDTDSEYGGGGTTGQFFSSAQSGYRFYLINSSGERVSSILDLVEYKDAEHHYTDVPNNQYYVNAYNEALTSYESTGGSDYICWTWSEMGSYLAANEKTDFQNNLPTPPLVAGKTEDSDNAYIPKGAEFKQWVINGIGGTSFKYMEEAIFSQDIVQTDTVNTTSINKGTSINGGSSHTRTYTKEDLGSDSGAYEIVKNCSTSIDLIEVATSRANEIFNKNYTNKVISVAAVRRSIRNRVYTFLVNEYGSQYTDTQYLKAAALMALPTIEGAEVASLEDTSTTDYALNTIESLGLEQIIPTDNSEGYLIEALSYKTADGNNIFYITDTDNVDVKTSIPETIVANELYLIVEPVFWTKYTTVYDGVDEYYSYGTYRNLVNVYVNHGYMKSKPNNKQLMTIYGWRSLTIGEAFNPGEELSLSVPSWSTTEVSIQDLWDRMWDTGYAMHVYGHEGDGSTYTKTRSDDTSIAAGTAHAAPKVDSEVENKISIVKTYQESDDDGETYKHKTTYISEDEPNDVYILNEETWEITEWYVSSEYTKSVTSKTEWDTMKKAVYSNNSSVGDISKLEEDNWEDNTTKPSNPGYMETVDGTADNKKVLYVLLRRKESDSNLGVTDTTISESQISKIDTLNTEVNSSSNLVLADYANILLAGTGKEKSVADGTKYKYVHTIFRGNDGITLAKYVTDTAENSSALVNADEEGDTALYCNNFSIGNLSALLRQSSNYVADYKISLKENDEDEATDTDRKALVEVYAGSETSIDKKCKATGKINKVRVKSAKLEFIPFIWMTTATIGSNNRQVDTINNVLSEYKRTIIPNDYAEVTVGNNSGSIKISSGMWATDKSIQNLTGGTNNALKGGATYYISTPNTGKIYINTYQAVMDSEDASNYVAVDYTTVDEATSKHNNLVFDSEDVLGLNYKLVQYVTNEDGDKVKAYSGANISKLGNGNSTASKESKYYLNDYSGNTDDNAEGTWVSSANLQVDTKSKNTTFYRFFTLPNGNMYLVSANTYEGAKTSMKNILNAVKANGGNDTTGSSGTSQYVILTKGEKSSNLADTGLDKTAKTINSKTNIVTKMLKTLERNSGEDTNASWASTDGAWYNEGCLGVTIMVQKTTVEVGIHTYGKRTF